MRIRLTAVLAAAMVIGALAAGQAGQAPPGSKKQRLNPMIDLLDQQKPIFGLYAPANRGGGAGRPGGAGAPVSAAPPAAPKTPLELAKDALAQTTSDYIFSGSMEGGVDRGLAAFTEFAGALGEAGLLVKSPYPHLQQPLVVKTPKIAEDPVKAIDNISRQLNTGVSTIVFVGVESANEVKQGLAAMRYASQGGTRPDTTGTAPALWGLSEADYKKKADVWPLNPNGELVNWTIVESKEGLAHVKEIAAVKGIGVLWPGAGTLRQVFSTTQPDGTRKLDEAGWENAIQTVLAACKEFNVPCGYPANATDIEMRMKQGFSVFVMNWGDPGVRAIEIGKKAAGR